MTTDITELAQRMKAAAEKATPGPWYVHDKPCEDGNYGIDTSDKEFLAEAVVWWGFARQSIWREEDAKYIALANPANILALVEALEKAQAKADVYDMLRDDYGLREKGVGLADFVDWQAKCIAELESRAVKLPKFKMLEDYLAEVAIEERKQILVGVKLEFHRALSDAGIKVEAE
ncbi:TPA: ead/Ea22-like family protein [Klebsiella pneumoniae]|uniref:ead/Ea22-like family protein n=1 Tax=Klebsiella pneumoniae TaxID=573 RepID=UPI001C8253B4|nr:ead/Ea22-like family protein [Klebsiella pneumoniae]MBX4735006.1 hypothetical protein [Klebsiella pneumoniae]HDY8480205.1 ead/Ea22-like family protein [Klebsiella pneumoniae]